MAVRSLGVVGIGQMGLGIVQVAARSGLGTVAVKASGAGGTAKARARLEKSYDRDVEKGRLGPAERDEALSRIEWSEDLGSTANCDLIIESVVEHVGTKRELFARLDQTALPRAVVATNTSTLNLKDLAPQIDARGHFLGLHFFNPVPAMKLVEVAPTRTTRSEVVDLALAFARGLGKVPVVVSDSSGYVVNRLLTPYLLDAIRCLETGLASAADIDRCMQLGCGFPMGPLSLADYIGLDVVLAMSEQLSREHRLEAMAPPETLKKLVAAGQLGKKSGLGLFDYSVDPPAPNFAAARR